MGERHRAEGDFAVCALAQAVVESIGTADREREARIAVIAQLGDLAREVFAREARARFIECPERRAFRQQRRNSQRFIDLAIIGTTRAAFGDFANVERTEPYRAARGCDALAVARNELTFGAGFQPADTENLKPQAL